MTRKTPEEIEAINNKIQAALYKARESHAGVIGYSDFAIGYTSNQELADFKKELVEKLEAMRKPDEEKPSTWDTGYIAGIGAAIIAVKFMTNRDLKKRWKEDYLKGKEEDQPEGEREELRSPETLAHPIPDKKEVNEINAFKGAISVPPNSNNGFKKEEK
jgi:hypothetical protein